MTLLRRSVVIALALAGLSACGPSATPDASQFYLVRHAEKTADATDPGLTEAGQSRADALAERLREAGITAIHSSDTRRTRDTAAPLAQALGLPVALYDPRDLSGLAERLLGTPGTHLVVGHSNTTPQLAELLGGRGGDPIVEATEYDRLYVITRAYDFEKLVYHTRIERYGAPTPTGTKREP